MSENNVSGKVTNVCQTCGIPESCYQKITIKEIIELPNNEYVENLLVSWPDKDNFQKIYKIRVSSNLAKLAIQINEKHPEKSHKASISSDKQRLNKKLALNKEEIVELQFVDYDGWYFSVEKLWDIIANVMAPVNAFKNPHFYDLKVDRCNKTFLGARLAIKPSFKVGFAASFSWSTETGTREDKDRKAEQRSLTIKKKEEKGQALPKDLNHLHKGWTLNTVPFFKTDKMSFDVEFSCNVGGHEYSLIPYQGESGKTKLLSDFEGLSKIDKFTSIFKDRFLHISPSAKKSEEPSFPLFSFTLNPLKIGLTFFHEDSENPPNPKTVIGIQGTPLIGFDFKIDVIQLLASISGPGTAMAAEKLRSALSDRSKKNKQYQKKSKTQNTFSADIEAEIVISCSVHAIVGRIHTLKDGSKFGCDKGVVELGVKGSVSLSVETSIFFMEASLNAGFQLETKGSFEIDSHDDGIDAVACHDGISLRAWFKADLHLSSNKNEEIEQQESTLAESKPLLYQIAPALKAEDSDVRINITGKERVTRPRKQVEPHVVPMYSNPILDAYRINKL